MGRQKQMSQRTHDMYAYYCEGHSLLEVAERWGVSKQRVHQIFERYGLKMRQPYQPIRLKCSNLDEIYSRYQAGERIDDLAQEYGLSSVHIYHLLRKNAYPLQALKGSEERVAEMYRDYQDGLTHRQIAEKHNISQGYVSALFRKFGFTEEAETYEQWKARRTRR